LEKARNEGPREKESREGEREREKERREKEGVGPTSFFISFDSWNKLVRTGPHRARAMFQLEARERGEARERERERGEGRGRERQKGRENEARSVNRPLKGVPSL